MDTLDISYGALGLAFLLLGIPCALSIWLRLALIRPLLSATLRMVAQLFLIGIFLKYLFALNSALVNCLWLSVMICVAVFSVVRSSGLALRKMLLPAFISFAFATGTVLLYVNTFVLALDYVFDARYLIVLGGMLLGNSLRGAIIGIGNFYGSVRKDHAHYVFLLSLGATRFEATQVYVREALISAIKPSLAAMATIGIVSLPGMMTGVILGGADPTVAIKYQIMIMIAIIVSTCISVVLTIILSIRTTFTAYGILDESLYSTR